jgi:hypothetical protein
MKAEVLDEVIGGKTSLRNMQVKCGCSEIVAEEIAGCLSGQGQKNYSSKPRYEAHEYSSLRDREAKKMARMKIRKKN